MGGISANLVGSKLQLLNCCCADTIKCIFCIFPKYPAEFTLTRGDNIIRSTRAVPYIQLRIAKYMNLKQHQSHLESKSWGRASHVPLLSYNFKESFSNNNTALSIFPPFMAALILSTTWTNFLSTLPFPLSKLWNSLFLSKSFCSMRINFPRKWYPAMRWRTCANHSW